MLKLQKVVIGKRKAYGADVLNLPYISVKLWDFMTVKDFTGQEAKADLMQGAFGAAQATEAMMQTEFFARKARAAMIIRAIFVRMARAVMIPEVTSETVLRAGL